MKILPILLITTLLASAGISSANDNAMLIRLYEEEILAHDLYVALSKEHPDIMPLNHIPHSEKRHQGILAEILKENGIALPEPAEGKRFVSTDLDETFNTWLEEGKKTEADACRVGVRLEEFDIADLREAQDKLPKYKDTLKLLEDASENHLRAFHRNLTGRGGTYDPKALSKDDFTNILASEGSSCGNCKNDSGKGQQKGECKGKCEPASEETCKGKCDSKGKGKGKGPGKRKGQN